MRILFSLTYYSPYVSGLTICVSRIAEGLAYTHAVSVLAMQHDKKNPFFEKINSVHIIRARPLFKISKGFFSIDWVIKSFQEVRKSDVVVVNLPQVEGIVPAFFAKLFGKKLMTIYHCDLKLPTGVVNRIAELSVMACNGIILSLSDKVITYTEDFAKNSPMVSQFLKKSEYIYPPIIKPEINKRIQKDIRNKIDTGKEFILGIAARLAAEKGIEYVLEAVEMLNAQLTMHKKKFKLIIAGPLNPVGEEAYKKKILNLVKKYKDQIIFLGSIKPDEMGSFYSLLDVLLLPSVNSTEAFGMVQVEAMMYGVPVIASDLPGVRVPVQKTGMGRVVPIKNPEAILRALVEIADEKKLRKSDTFHKMFSYTSSIQDYERVITNL